MVELKQFQNSSIYERKVDYKKLKFIFDAITRYLKETSKHPETLNILEVGCGDGSITIPLSTFGGTVTAFDLDDSLVANLSKLLQIRKISNVKVSKENAYSYHNDDKFDIIVASEVLEHLDDPEKVVSNLKSQLVTGGYCIITVPNGFGPWEMSNKIKKILSFKGFKETECGHKHVQFFTMNRLKRLFTAHNLALICFGKSDAFSGMIYSIATNPVIASADMILADLLPSFMVSGWYFVVKNRGA